MSADKNMHAVCSPAVRFAGGVLFALSLGGCAPALDSFTGKVLYQDTRLTPEEFSGNSVMVFPLIKRGAFDTTGAITAQALGQWLRQSHEDLEIYFKEDFEREMRRYYPQWIDTFYLNLLNHNFIAMQADTVGWYMIASNYILAIYVKDGGRIKDFHRNIKRTVWMEAEIWSVEPPSVVWRVEVKGFERNAQTSDADFIRRGVQKIFSLLPPYHPSPPKEEVW